MSDRNLPQFALLIVTAPVAILLYLVHFRVGAFALGAFDLWLLFCLFLLPKKYTQEPGLFRLGPLVWRLEDVRRHWICVGKSGCGKTLAFLKTFLLEFLRKMDNPGGVAVDEKGDLWELIVKVFRATGRLKRLVVLRVALPNNANFVPEETMNLIGDRALPWETWAQIVVDVAVSQGQKSANPHFKNQARQRIADTFETLEATDFPVTLANAYEFLKFDDIRTAILQMLQKNGSEKCMDLYRTWEMFFTIGGEEASSIKTTCENYLAPYKHPEIAKVFSAEKPTVQFSIIESGKWIIPSVPQAYLTQRSYIIAFFKVLFYNWGLRRFDRGSAYLNSANDLCLLADEGQNSILASEEGMSDIKSLDKLRAAKCTIALMMQDYASAVPQIEGKEKATVLFANLNNHVIFSLNTAEGRKMAADIIDKREVKEVTLSVDATGKASRSYRPVQKYYYEPSFFKNMRKFKCVIQHCEGPHARATLPPLTDDGSRVESWYWKARFKTA